MLPLYMPQKKYLLTSKFWQKILTKHIFPRLSLLASAAKLNLFYIPLPLETGRDFLGSCFGQCFLPEISTVAVILTEVGYLIVGSISQAYFLQNIF